MSKIVDKKTYRQVLWTEGKYYRAGYQSRKERFLLRVKRDPDQYYIWAYLKRLRKAEYYLTRVDRLISRLLYYYNERKKNILGSRLGFSIPDGVLGLNATVYHPNLVIHPKAIIGDACVFHGNNCIGNKGKPGGKAPTIGNGVEFGFGAVVVGDVEIADGVIIGANSVVTKSISEKNAIVVGNPAKILPERGMDLNHE